MPVGVYRAVQRATLQRGLVVLACLPRTTAEFARKRRYVPNGSCDSGTAPLGKEIVAVAGDTVTVVPEGLIVRGVLIRNSKALRRDSRGRSMPRIAASKYPVPNGEFWAVSTYSERSFDSRYFGPLPTSSIVAIVRPVVVFR